MPVHDQSVGRVVGGNPDGDLVPDDDADVESAHLSAEFCGDGHLVFKFNFVKPASAGVDDFTL